MDLYKENRAVSVAHHWPRAGTAISSFGFSGFKGGYSVQPGLMSVLVFVYPCSLDSHEDGYWVEAYWEPCTWISMDGVCCHKDGITAIPILYFSHYLCAAVNFCVNLGKKNPPNQVARVEHLISSFLPLIHSCDQPFDWPLFALEKALSIWAWWSLYSRPICPGNVNNRCCHTLLVSSALPISHRQVNF